MPDYKTEQNKPHSDCISSDLQHNLAKIQQLFTETPDMITRHLTIKQSGRQAVLIYIDGLNDKAAINDDVLRPLQQELGEDSQEIAVTVGHVGHLSSWEQAELAFFQGNSLLFIDGEEQAYALDTKGWPQRNIEDPQLESSLKGAHQGFLESGDLNIALIRRYIPHRGLKIKRIMVGERGRTIVSIMYIEDIANEKYMAELERRIRQIKVDAIINTGELCEFIEDNPFSLFPQLITTERPDTTASQLLQGRCAVVVDRSPNVLIAPVTFMSFFQNIDDYSSRWTIATFLRLLRMFAFITAAFLPAIYISVVSYHFEIIPLKLLLTLGESRGQVPFPPFVEAILMETTLELLREAGIRLPAPVGQTVGIVGGIVIGQAVVQAGLISNVMVIVVAFTAISSFILPNYDMVAAVRLIRFILMILASMFGFVGLVIGFMTMFGHIIALKSLGTSYGSPIAPVRLADLKDTLIRVPLWLMDKRPLSTAPKQSKRQRQSRVQGDEE
ncbi:spore germination protein [Paenibacillus sp. KS-LC4]|uniref:spore germination protein n=1 Tax=Paenibacillus sp. KS-LC4 TaxID=2979727 RepID=UPI0030CA7D44